MLPQELADPPGHGLRPLDVKQMADDVDPAVLDIRE
jgi:hypothetical protein